MTDLKQTPAPGSEQILHRGDILTLTLEVPPGRNGAAWLRTNLGLAGVRRREIIAHTEHSQPVLARDWHDLPMREVAPGRHQIALPLLQTGIFEAKAFFSPEGQERLEWPGGGNSVIKVEPAGTCAGNTMYTAFVRQFGPNRLPRNEDPAAATAIARLDDAGYTVIPRSGTFRDLARELDFIVGTLQCRIVQLLPIHPAPTTYARMGRYGSPFAALDFFDVDPAYAEFDPRATPMAQFLELADAVHARGARLFIDIPVNHTGWGSRQQIHHPERFVREADGTFVSPGAWGVTWADLCKLDYHNPEVHRLMADVFLFWCHKGVDGFRCDAGYMLPRHAWEYITARVREEFPDTVFMLEGLGGPLAVVEEVLGRGNLNWAYSELFQNYDQGQLCWYLPYAIRTSATKGTLIHFAETHDNARLAARSPAWARLRLALCALASDCGAFGFANGAEWLAREKIDVHGASPLNWGAPDNLVAWIRRLNLLLASHESFQAGTRLELVQASWENSVVLLRQRPDPGRTLAMVANLDDAKPSRVAWPAARFDHAVLVDLLTGDTLRPARQADGTLALPLAPGEIRCLTPHPQDLAALEAALAAQGAATPAAALAQESRAMALEAWQAVRRFSDAAAVDTDALAREMRQDPRSFLCRLHGSSLPPVTGWAPRRDQHRQVPVLPGHHLLATADAPFQIRILEGGRVRRTATALPAGDGTWFAILPPLAVPAQIQRLQAECCLHTPQGSRHFRGTLWLLPEADGLHCRLSLPAPEVRAAGAAFVGSNRRGGLAHVRGAWGELRSKYDALLAGNVDRRHPVDRRVMFTRCRAWLVYRDFSQAVDLSCLDRFRAGAANQAEWEFSVPCGQGQAVSLALRLEIDEEEDRIRLLLQRRRRPATASPLLDDNAPVTLILRPDLEDRNCHETTKAFQGPEHAFPAAVRTIPGGLAFNPSGHRELRLQLDAAVYIPQPEWHYMAALPEDGERGLEATTDLFSPGYFQLELAGGDGAVLTATIAQPGDPVPAPPDEFKLRPLPESRPLGEQLRLALERYLVRRDDTWTVIAGYPWFLDWGRDSLIALRGVIAAGQLDTAAGILQAFARFEHHGTLPNMIRGGDSSNRDTSDAPLWFFVATADYLEHSRRQNLLDTPCGGRPLRQILHSIAQHYRQGTPNGIRMDPESALVYSPSHFTWMDTNHPAGSPRQGYPIEIQALWYAALRLMAKLEPNGDWQALAAQVQASIRKFYVRPGQRHLADCLHADPGMPASRAVADDANRPNQLLAITLGALDDPAKAAEILQACESLLVPGAIRSLDDAAVAHPLPVYRGGHLLNTPQYPYWGEYLGDEDTRRKPAYHNGTAWTWQFPLYAEALAILKGEAGRRTASALLGSCRILLEEGALGQLPEITDGNAPHRQRGCDAQAWGISEAFRVWHLLGNPS